MGDEPEDLVEYRRRQEATKERERVKVESDHRLRAAREFSSTHKDLLVKQAFADMVVATIRGALSGGADHSAVLALRYFLELVGAEPNVTAQDLIEEAQARIVPPSDRDEHSNEFALYLNMLAHDGAALLLEQAATDGFAAARRSKRRTALLDSIRLLNDHRETKRKSMLAARSPRSAQKDRPVRGKPKDTVTPNGDDA